MARLRVERYVKSEVGAKRREQILRGNDDSCARDWQGDAINGIRDAVQVTI